MSSLFIPGQQIIGDTGENLSGCDQYGVHQHDSYHRYRYHSASLLLLLTNGGRVITTHLLGLVEQPTEGDDLCWVTDNTVISCNTPELP